MRRSHWLALSLVFLLSDCGHGPKITVCVSDPQWGGFDCFNEETGKNLFLKYGDSDKYIALSPEDAKTLFNFCAEGK